MDIRLVVEPAWSNADAMAVLVKTAVTAVFARPDLGETIGVVAGELMENAVKYGDWSEVPRISFLLTSDERQLELEVTCPCNPSSDHYARLQASLQKIEAGNVRNSYMERMAEVGKNRNERGGLGLLRLAYEAECQLKAWLSEDLLHVRARLNIGAGPEQVESPLAKNTS